MKLLYYPYDNENYPYFSMSGCEECYLVSPKGWGYSGKKRIVKEQTYDVISDFYEKINNIDVVWIVNSRWNLDFEQCIYPLIERAVQLRKKLIVTRKLAQEELIKVKKVVPSELLLLPQYEKNDIEDRRLYTINATVIFVAELDESCSIDSTLMILKNEFIKKNYKIVTVMSKKEGMVVGLPVLPDFVNEHFNDQEQILYFNHFIKKLEELENPDIILIGISGALKNISSNVIGNMGMNVFKVSQAVLPDYVIVNLMISGWKEEYFKILSKDLSIFFRKDVDLFNIEDKVLDIDESENKQDTRYTTVSPEYTEKQIKKLCVKNVVHLSNEEQSSTVVEEIINRLQSYNELGDDYIV